MEGAAPMPALGGSERPSARCTPGLLDFAACGDVAELCRELWARVAGGGRALEPGEDERAPQEEEEGPSPTRNSTVLPKSRPPRVTCERRQDVPSLQGGRARDGGGDCTQARRPSLWL